METDNKALKKTLTTYDVGYTHGTAEVSMLYLFSGLAAGFLLGVVAGVILGV